MSVMLVDKPDVCTTEMFKEKQIMGKWDGK